ncbi:Sensor histidine kinase YehU [Lacunisphaera limnophila]|uniref:Sensor histidine kinase YehU n=1 Tax=Lacunisphaera limnophila TaxID=1838286 RepID=A0A1D8AV28_9BACT|nr:histidine kinase [Lacunisphaera limnophila]AOS44742.1 Sensor histidine kinase YehU [Lacunisphaera limnophila]
MTDHPLSGRSLLRFAGIGTFWTLVGLAFASQFYLSSTLLGRSVTWGQAIGYSLGDWYVWAVLSLPVLWLARRYPPEGAQPWRTAAIHLASALVCSLVYVLLRSLVGVAHSRLLDEPVTFAEVFRPLLVRTFPFNLLVYGVIVTISHAIDYYRKYHERTVHSLELEKHLTEARLQSLLRQLKPHFLFNTLNGIASLMHSDVHAADKMLVRLGELLRLTMHHPGQPLTKLREEIAFIEKYLEIERIRFRDRLTVEITAAPDTLDADVPSLIIQPLVENAIRHGLEPHARPGRITVMTRREGGGLLLVVRDNGGGMPAGGFTREGIGLANTRERLRELYGERHRFELANHPEGGLEVRLLIPL